MDPCFSIPLGVLRAFLFDKFCIKEKLGSYNAALWTLCCREDALCCIWDLNGNALKTLRGHLGRGVTCVMAALPWSYGSEPVPFGMFVGI